MAIILTDKAAQRIQALIAKDGHGVGLRLGIRKAGCSGMAYTFEIAEQISDNDQVFEHRNGAKVVVDASALPYLDGALLDFVREGLSERFKFHNPNEKAACGCGESVSFG